MRRNQPIHQVYIADGFADDCEELIHRCSRVDQLNYPTFCSHYKEMNFATVYQFRSSNAEIGELSEELLQIAKHYMVRDTSNFEESVAGLFLVYALMNLQPFPRFAALRIVQDDLPSIERIERVARRDNRLDVLYVLASVLVRGPVHFHADARPRGMEAAFRNNLEGFSYIDAQGVRPKGVYSRQNEELDLLRDMSGIFERYSKAKALVPGIQRPVETCRNLAVELGESLKRVINGITEEPEGSSVMDHHDTVQEIKSRAMRNAVATVRHLDSAELRTKKTSPKAKENCAKRLKKSKINPNSCSSSSEDDEDDKDIELLAKDVMSQASFKEIIKNKEPQLDIDTLPRLVTTESNGKLYEIEIIDEMEQPSLPILNDKQRLENDQTKDSRLIEIGKVIEIEYIDKEKNYECQPSSTANVEKINEELKEKGGEKGKNKPKKIGRPRKSPKNEAKKQKQEDTFIPPLRTSPRLKQVLKRDQKKPILKSKFKKMGMLEVANFQEKQ